MRQNTFSTERSVFVKIAIMSDRADERGVVPDGFESSPVMLICETDDENCAVLAGKVPGEYVAAMIEEGCEAVICGQHIGKEAFEPIAEACISRYRGTGLPVMEALRGALENSLPMITDFEGGPGCSDGVGNCQDGGCGH